MPEEDGALRQVIGPLGETKVAFLCTLIGEIEFCVVQEVLPEVFTQRK